LELDKELCVCFTDWQNAFDHLKQTKLMQMLKETGIDWREKKKMTSKPYIDQITIRPSGDKICEDWPKIVFNLYSEYLTNEALEPSKQKDKQFAQ
jgi:hypothetical protein